MTTTRRAAAIILAALTLLPAACAGRGSTIREQIHAGMSMSEVLQKAEGWTFCSGILEPQPTPESRVNVYSAALEVRGFGDEDKTLTYANREEVARALVGFMQKHPGTWHLTFGYAVVPRRQYFDVLFDANAKVIGASEVRLGGPR